MPGKRCTSESERVLRRRAALSRYNKKKYIACPEEKKERERKRPSEMKCLAVKRWREKNRGSVNAINSKRRSSLLRAIPKWANLKEIGEFYKNCPAGLTVDHVVPLQGTNVCGFHVIYNMQYLTKSENSRKGNRMKEGY